MDNPKLKDKYLNGPDNSTMMINDLSNAIIPGILSTGYLLYRPQDVELFAYGIIIIFIAYQAIMRLSAQARLENLTKLIFLGVSTFIGLMYLFKKDLGSLCLIK